MTACETMGLSGSQTPAVYSHDLDGTPVAEMAHVEARRIERERPLMRG